MELRTAASPKDVKFYDTKRLREEFLIEKVFRPDEIYLVYSHIDRIITGAATPVSKKLKLDSAVLDIHNSRAYIDAGHHRMPDSSSYYLYNNEPYYFLRDNYGGYTHKPQVDSQYEYLFPEDESTYVTENQSGWYKYTDDGWEYYADSEDKEKLGDDLYYNPGNYTAGTTVYDFSQEAGDTWNITDFSQTDWYLSAQEAQDIYNNTYDIEHKYSSVYTSTDDDYDDDDYDWDDDDDWDWDTGDDWDYGGTDWDTDW